MFSQRKRVHALLGDKRSELSLGVSKEEHGQATRVVLAICLLVVLLEGTFFQSFYLLMVFLSFAMARRVHRKKTQLEHFRKFESEFPAFLLSLSSAVKTGLDPLAALEQSETLFPQKSVMRSELGKIRGSLEQGTSEIEALKEFGSSLHCPDLCLFRSAFLLSRNQGASLSQCLQRLAKVTRQRQSFRRKIRAALAMQRLSAFGIVGCASLATLVQTVNNWQSVHQALSDPLGFRAIVLGISLLTIGFIWMLYLSRTRGAL